jgi:hypothetical protein
VPEEDRLALGQVRGDGVGVHVPLHRVRHQDHDHVSFLAGDRRGDHPQALGLGLGPATAVLGEADPDVDTRVPQAQRVGVTLAAVTEDGDLTTLDDRQVGVVVVVHLRHRTLLRWCALPGTTSPVAPRRHGWNGI